MKNMLTFFLINLIFLQISNCSELKQPKVIIKLSNESEVAQVLRGKLQGKFQGIIPKKMALKIISKNVPREVSKQTKESLANILSGSDQIYILQTNATHLFTPSREGKMNGEGVSSYIHTMPSSYKPS